MKFEVINADCLEAMRDIPDGSIDACVTDIPYGTTACAWDSVIPFAPMWAAIKRVVKEDGAILLFCSQPFTSALVMSNPGMFRYELVYEKEQSTGGMNANKMPLRSHENIAVFYSSLPTYNPQFTSGRPYQTKRDKPRLTSVYGKTGVRDGFLSVNEGVRFPRSVIRFGRSEEIMHPTQKPVDLLRYLVRTYSNEGDTVLDFTCGSGTTGVACAIEGRGFIGIEQDEHYAEVSRARIKRALGEACDMPRRIRVEKELPLFSAA